MQRELVSAVATLTILATLTTALQSSVGTAAAAVTATASGPAQDNLTYHRTNARLGWYSNETQLTVSSVGSSAFHLIGTMATNGKSYSQPLYVSNQTTADGSTHNLVFITDSTDVVSAYDADTLDLVWRRSFTGAGVRQQLASDTQCDDTWPNVGINGTPVIDRQRNALYVVVPTFENSAFFLRLHAISLANGNDVVSPTVIQNTSGQARVSAEFNFNRAGLLEAGATIYVALSTHCDMDASAAHGWLFAYDATTLAQKLPVIDPTPKDIGSVGGAEYLGSIWQGGFGIAADDDNNIFFATGNGPNDANSDFAMSVIRLPSSLVRTTSDFFTPSTWQTDSGNDHDLGSGGVMLLPDQSTGPYKALMIAGGKTGVKYLLRRDQLGRLAAVDHIPYEAQTGGGIFGGPAYFVDAQHNQTILYGGSPNLNAYRLTTAPYGLQLQSATNVGTLESRNAGVTPIVSSNGTTAASAVVWTIMTSRGSGSQSVVLFAFDAANLAHTLFSAKAGVWTSNGDTGGALITPLVANGRVYLATDGVVSVFGLH